MGLACPRYDEAFADRIEEARAMAHRAIDEWVDGLARLGSADKGPTLLEITEDFRRRRREMAPALLGAALGTVHGDLSEQEWADCPRCGRQLRRKRLDPKEVSTLEGRLTVLRPYFHCRRCQIGFHPLDEILGLTPDVHQPDVEREVLDLAARLPFEEAAAVFERLVGIGVGEHFGHQTLHAVGESATLGEVIPTAHEIAERIRDATTDGADLPILVVAADGAHLPTRPQAARKAKRGQGQYREAKGFRLYLAAPDERIVHVASWHQIQDAKAFRADLEEVAQRIPRDQVRIALLADGAEWLWDAMIACFPEGRPILDYFHVAEHVHAVARTLYGEGLPATQWAEVLKTTIYVGKIPTALTRLRRVRARTPAAREEVRKLVGYLWKHRHKLRHEASRAEGYPLGSGGIESAHKFIAHTRMKRTGAWWVEAYGNSMLRIRCALYNGTLDRVFQSYQKHRASGLRSGDK